MNDKLLAVKEAIYEMGLLFNQSPGDERITAYANFLVEYEPQQIIFAFKKVINSGSAFFPSLAEILKHLNPNEEVAQDKAPQIASEMLQALRWYGPHDEKRMIENVSDEARLTFLKLGYTGDIRNSENIDTIRAQLERLARSVLSSRANQIKNLELEQVGIDVSKILTMRKPGMRSLNFDGPEPA